MTIAFHSTVTNKLPKTVSEIANMLQVDREPSAVSALTCLLVDADVVTHKI